MPLDCMKHDVHTYYVVPRYGTCRLPVTSRNFYVHVMIFACCELWACCLAVRKQGFIGTRSYLSVCPDTFVMTPLFDDDRPA